ncbi:hypothetical protein EPN90_00765 [Patescibacteria group bacterium]|nr:MAG: hypothetical protein EPN90_00765 [Patescibacteria group bacterium]
MIIKSFFQKLRGAYERYSSERREVVKESGDALSLAKQAIFAFHRDDREKGEELLAAARVIQGKLAKRFQKIPALVWEGSYRAMLEEYVEASLYGSYLRGEKIGEVRVFGLDEDAYLGGLLDFTGELSRRAVTEATKKNIAEVRRAHAAAEAVMGELIKLNIAGPLRPKYDQAKTNFRKLEEILYDLSLR